MHDLVEVWREGRVARVALNRPEKRNALSLALCRELADVLDEADRDPEVGAILLSGNGKSFCAGMDLNEVLDAESGEIDAVHERVFTAGLRLNTPIVAAVHGAALAGGTGLAANCHVAVAADDATFGLTEIRLGLWPFVVFRVVEAAVGLRRATELALTGRIFGAAEAERYGMVHRIVAARELELAAQDVAAGIAGASGTAVRGGLEYVRASRGRNVEEAGEIARRTREEVFRSPEFREGIRAFRERRKAG